MADLSAATVTATLGNVTASNSQSVAGLKIVGALILSAIPSTADKLVLNSA
jgi:hypothetical protein